LIIQDQYAHRLEYYLKTGKDMDTDTDTNRTNWTVHDTPSIAGRHSRAYVIVSIRLNGRDMLSFSANALYRFANKRKKTRKIMLSIGKYHYSPELATMHWLEWQNSICRLSLGPEVLSFQQTKLLRRAASDSRFQTS
jgi:hypothetical protein